MAETSFRIQGLDETNAAHVPEVFRAVYGDAYVDPSVYQPQALLRKIDQGKLCAVVALDADGCPAGYAALGATTPNPFLWENKGLVVVPEYKNTNVGTALVKVWGNPADWPAGVKGLFGATVCHHYFA